MSYLFTKIILCLLLAALLGWFIGWLMRGFRAGSELGHSEADWKAKLGRSDSHANELKLGLEKSNQQVSTLQERYDALIHDHKFLADKYQESDQVTEKIRVSLKHEQEKSGRLYQELKNSKADGARLKVKLAKEHDVLNSLSTRESSSKSTIDDLNSYLEQANEKNQQLREEVYQIGKALNEASVAISDRDQAISTMEPRLAEQELLLQQQLKQLSQDSASNESLMSQFKDTENELGIARADFNDYRQESARLAGEYRTQIEQLETQVSALEQQKNEQQDEFNIQMDLAAKERNEALEKETGTAEKLNELNQRFEQENKESVSHLDSIQQQLERANTELVSLRATNKELTEAASAAVGYEKEAVQLKQILLEKDTDFIQLEEKLAARSLQREEENNSLQSLLDSTQEQMQSQIESNDKLEEQITVIQKQYDDQEQVLEQTQQRLKVAEGEASDASAVLDRKNSELEEKIQSLQAELSGSNGKISELQSANHQLSYLIDQSNSSQRVAEENQLRAEKKLTDDYEEVKKQLSASREKIETLSKVDAENRELEEKIQSLQTRLSGSSSKINELQSANHQLSGLIDQSNSSLRVAEENQLKAGKKLADDFEEVKEQLSASREKIETLSKVDAENRELIRQVDTLNEKLRDTESEKLTLMKTLNSHLVDVDQLSSQLNAEPSRVSRSGGQPASLSAPRQGDADDLKRISGVGKAIEEVLNKLGIYHFSQIAEFSNENIDWVNEHLNFKGRIEREGWIQQAKALARGGSTEFSNRYDRGAS